MALRTRLSLVTALTVGSLLFGGSQLSALAKEQGAGKGNANKVEHAQANAQRDNKHAERDQRQAERDEDKAEREHAKPETVHVQANNVQAAATNDNRVDEPDRVTGATRPGLGCGDDNHVHTGPPGNPDKECKAKHQDNDDDDDESEEVEAEDD